MKLDEGSYRPAPVRRVTIPKPAGGSGCWKCAHSRCDDANGVLKVTVFTEERWLKITCLQIAVIV